MCMSKKVGSVEPLFFKKTLPCARAQTHGKQKTLGKIFVLLSATICRVLSLVAHGKYLLCRVLIFYRVFVFLHSANGSFAVCPRGDSRQSLPLTAI